MTTKRMGLRDVLRELLWFISGSTNISDLHPCTIWDEWADDTGSLGPVYGKQWRDWNGIDQLANVVERIKTTPHCRRHIVSAWNVDDLDKMALMPCHMLYQFYVRRERYLDLRVEQRSCDMFLGLPYNIASYAALIHMVAHITDLKPGKLYWLGGDCHIYNNHINQVSKQ